VTQKLHKRHVNYVYKFLEMQQVLATAAAGTSAKNKFLRIL